MRRFLISLFFVVIICFARTSEARKLALLVGVDEYENVPSLKCCVNDMKTLKEALTKIGFKEDDIQILVTGGKYRDFPTKRKIQQRISDILSDAQPSDMIFFAFSGHGAQEGEMVYFCPPDVEVEDLEGTCVSITKVMDDLANSKAKFKWMVVDACRNNPTQGARAIGGKGLQTVPAPPAGIALFQSCAEGEESWEDREIGNGYFTKNFVAALSGAADSDQDGQLTLMEVCKWTTAQTKAEVQKAENKTQRPYFSGSVSDFVLIENMDVEKAKILAADAQKAMEEENYELAVEKFDAALALCPQFSLWKRERDLAQILLEKGKALQEAVEAASKAPPTSPYSFEWDGTKIKKFIGTETEVVLPDNVTEIGEWAFSYSSITSITFSKNVAVIGAWAFSDCKSLTSVVIPPNVKVIKHSAFSGCCALTSVEIPDGIIEIENHLFEKCTSLTSVTIPESVTKIGYDVFKGCSALTSVVLPKGITEINSSMFENCSSLTSVEIPENVTEIRDSAFRGCSSLKSIKIPEGVTWINDFVFEGCSSLTSVVIPQSVTRIGIHSFKNCSALTSLKIPDSVNEISIGAFSGCTGLKEWPISSSHPFFKSVGNCLLTKDGKRLIACLATAKECQIPESVTRIYSSAFEGCSSLTSVQIPEGVTEIGSSAFEGCSSLTSIQIPEGVTKIGSSAFEKCSSLTSINIPKGMTEIGIAVFERCSSLTSVVIPEGVTEIRLHAFSDCSSLTSVVIPKSVTKIDEKAFEDCPNLTIYAPSWSVAQKFANAKKIPFRVKNGIGGNYNYGQGYQRRY